MGRGLLARDVRPDRTSFRVRSRSPELPEFILPHAQRLALERGGARELESDVLLIGHRPDIAPLAYDLVLFPPLTSDELDSYQRIHSLCLPKPIAKLLLAMNGCTFFDLRIYGAPLSMAREPPMLDRSVRAPLDIASAQRWSVNFLSSPRKATLFASRNLSAAGQIGYFLTAEANVLGCGNGADLAPADSGSWPNFAAWATSQFAVVRAPSVRSRD